MEEYKSACLEAESLVNGERGNSYGHPLDDFTRTARIWSAILEIDITAEQVGLCMIGVKLSRECNRHKADNLIDTCGYAEAVNKLIYERQRRHNTMAKLMQTNPVPDTQLCG